MGPYELKGPISDDTLNKSNRMFHELYGVVYDLVGTITEEVFEQIIDGSKLTWNDPVDSFNDLPTEADEGETRMVRETGKIYRFSGTEWMEIQEIDATAINEVESRLNTKIDHTRDEVTSKVEKKSRIILSTSEPQDVDDETFWYEDKGDANVATISVANATVSNEDPENSDLWFKHN